MRWRGILAGFAALLFAPPHASAQQLPPKIPRIGILSQVASPSAKVWEAFRAGLGDLGYIDGQNITIEFRLFAGDYSRLPAMTADLVGLPVDIIVAEGTNVAKFVQDTTRTIPIVLPSGGDPVAAGVAESLAHPGRNVTGVVHILTEVSAKRLQLLKEAFPAISRVAALWNPAGLPYHIRATEDAARLLAVQLLSIKITTPDQIGGAEGLTILPDATLWNERAQVVALAAQRGFPAIYPERSYAEEGGLLTYGPSVTGSFRRAAWYVDKILQGAKPGDLPIEQPTKFELVVNLRTAKALGLTVPPSILARADEVIE